MFPGKTMKGSMFQNRNTLPLLIRIYLQKYCLQAVGLLHHLADGVGGIIRQGIEAALSVL